MYFERAQISQMGEDINKPKKAHGHETDLLWHLVSWQAFDWQ
jgi:hypothetical protein